jgi:stage II sporulation protein E
VLLKGKMDKPNGKHIERFDYGKRKLLTYADSFRELAKTFEGNFDFEGEDRQTFLEARKLWENRQVLCENLNEMAQIMTRVAGEVFRYSPLETRIARQIIHTLRGEGIIITDMFNVEQPGERKGIGITMHSVDRGTYTSEEVADMLSVLTNERLSASVTSPGLVDQTSRNFIFVEEARYLVLTGVSKAVKENELVSGDNYAFVESEKGRMTILLSDGMGSGEKASASSERVLDLMEKMLEAGYGVDTAISLVNSALVAQGEEENISTLDVCDFDLHNGQCNFIKVGGAASFIKRGNMVEQLSSKSLPLGIFPGVESEVIPRELTNGDYVVMLSDGVLDALDLNHYEEALEHYLSGIQDRNPGEMADKLLQFVLHCGGGRIPDDMTIIVAGIWENT